MLLSMFISFVLARRFSGRNYVTLIIVTIALLSFFSAFGWITLHQRTDFTHRTSQWYKLSPVPLSLPFYASVLYDMAVRPLPIDSSRITYRIGLLTVEILSVTESYSSFTLGQASVYFSFFFLVNLIGAILGYWINKSTFIDRYFTGRKPKTSLA
jgi:hypothetical protein